MKMVEIVAKGLDAWPGEDGGFDVKFITQNAKGCVETWEDDGPLKFEDGAWNMERSIPVEDKVIEHAELATDHATAIVTREMWEAERAGLEGQKQWIGEGLPPAGALIEWDDHGEWLTLEVVGSYRGSVVAVDPDAPSDVYIGKRPQYRPIDTRTPRDKWIEAADRAIGHGLSLHGKLGALYDAGLARLPD